MDHRPPLGTPRQRPQPPQRAVSGSYAYQQGLKRAPQPSRLNNVRSVSQPVNVVDLTVDAARTDVRNTAAFLNNADKLYTSPGAISLDDDIDDRPTKRAKTGEGASRVRESYSEAEQDTARQVVPGSPLPSLPSQKNVTAGRNASQKSRKAVVDRAVRQANGLEPPPMATRLPAPKNVADFHPWNGHHSEDILTETAVKAGYFDKPPGPNSTETNSGKPTIWPNLSAKNNMGLSALNYLFTSVMEKRQMMGRCTAPSTFKPPPRVTVTDTKREAWLRDLANADVPLRKQSRTIPHGIRGKLLMDQCVGKNIPMPRAVWLAKCVGANELRAFRRKGVSGAAAATGESKWIREWTVQVEHFLEGVIAACGQSEWQAKMDYAVKLATSFYAERLLEREHYLDWIVSSYSQAHMDRLPIWIILVQLYWKDITSFGRRGQRLAEATLERLDRIIKGEIRTNETLRARLQKLIMVMAVTNRGCLIVPKTWQKYRYLLTPRTSALDTPAQNIVRRNDRLVAPLLKTPQNTRCPLLQLYNLLDKVGLQVDVEQLSAACLAVVPDFQQLVHALLNWSASVYRTGKSRVYLATKLISCLHSDGLDTDSAILDYLSTTSSAAIEPANVHEVVAHLTRIQAFSPGRYMQWLITSGISSCGGNGSLSTGLLAMLPLHSMSPHLLNTRNSLLRRQGVTTGDNQTKALVEAALHSMLDNESFEPLTSFASLSGTAKFEVAHKMTAKALESAKEGELSTSSFCILRGILEKCNDIPELLDVIEATMESEDATLLATMADTITTHASTATALGRLRAILDQLLERYTVLRSQQTSDRSLIMALGVLTGHFADKTHVLRMLDIDLKFCEQQSSMAVCSPASDNLVNMQASNLDSDADIDAVFASGNMMDEQLMNRVFTRIVQRAGKADSQTTQIASKLCEWLVQLRAVEPGSFENLLKNYVTAYMKGSGIDGPSLSVTGALIASGCMDFDNIVDLAREVGTPNAASTALQLLIPIDSISGLKPAELYRYRMLQSVYRRQHASKAIPTLASAMGDPRLPIDEDGLVNMVIEYAVSEYPACLQALTDAPLNPPFLKNCGRLVMKMLNLGNPSCADDVALDAKSIIALADPLSVVQCTGALALLSKAEAAKAHIGDAELQNAILGAVTSGCQVWPQLLEGAGQETTAAIYRWAKEQVLNNVMQQGGQESVNREEFSRNLEILDVAHHAIKEDSTSVIATITEKLKALENQLTTALESGDQDAKRAMYSLDVLLHLTILYSADATAEDDTSKPSRCNLLAALCILLGHSGLQRHQEVLEYIHDVASMLADGLPDDLLSSLGQNLHRSGLKDPRLSFILGNFSPPDAWLALASHPPPQGSQQQRALMKQVATQQQQQQFAAGRQAQPSSVQPQHPSLLVQKPAGVRMDGIRSAGEFKTVPYPLRRWEIMSDATPLVGENDTSLSLSLFGARKV